MPNLPIDAASKLLRRLWLPLLVALCAAGFLLAIQIPDLEINAESDAFMEDDDPGISEYYETREDWGWDEYAIICVTADDWFTPEGIERLQLLIAELADAPYVSEVMSVLDLPLLRQRPDELPNLFRIKSEIAYLADPDVDLTAAAAELRDHEIAVANLNSPDGRSHNLLLYLSYQTYYWEITPGVI